MVDGLLARAVGVVAAIGHRDAARRAGHTAGRRQAHSRLTLADHSNLAIENEDTPMHVGGLAVLDGAELVDASGKLDLPRLRQRLSLRLARVPALRQRIWNPGPLRGRPFWVDDPDFSIERHVQELEVPAPGDETELLAAVADLLRSPLDRRRPLWELWFLSGLSGARVGVLLKLHHAVADGLAAVALITEFFDLEPGAADPAPVPWTPSPPPTGWEAFAGAWADRLGALAATLRHPSRVSRGVAAAVAEAVATVTGRSAPRTSLNRRVRSGRRYRVVRLDLDAARSVAHAHSGKVNDVVLTVVAGGLRELLLHRGEQVDGVDLEVAVPVAQRSSQQARELGNATGVVRVPVPIGEADSSRRLRRIAAATRAAKEEQHPSHATNLIAWLFTVGIGAAFIARQRLINVFVTNIPGPPAPLYVLGARVLEMIPLTTLSGNVVIAFAALSYVGRLVLVVQVDPAAVPEAELIAAGLARSWAELAPSSRPEAGARPVPSADRAPGSRRGR